MTVCTQDVGEFFDSLWEVNDRLLLRAGGANGGAGCLKGAQAEHERGAGRRWP